MSLYRCYIRAHWIPGMGTHIKGKTFKGLQSGCLTSLMTSKNKSLKNKSTPHGHFQGCNLPFIFGQIFALPSFMCKDENQSISLFPYICEMYEPASRFEKSV